MEFWFVLDLVAMLNSIFLSSNNQSIKFRGQIPAHKFGRSALQKVVDAWCLSFRARYFASAKWSSRMRHRLFRARPRACSVAAQSTGLSYRSAQSTRCHFVAQQTSGIQIDTFSPRMEKRRQKYETANRFINRLYGFWIIYPFFSTPFFHPVGFPR